MLYDLSSEICDTVELRFLVTCYSPFRGIAYLAAGRHTHHPWSELPGPMSVAIASLSFLAIVQLSE